MRNIRLIDNNLLKYVAMMDTQVMSPFFLVERFFCNRDYRIEMRDCFIDVYWTTWKNLCQSYIHPPSERLARSTALFFIDLVACTSLSRTGILNAVHVSFFRKASSCLRITSSLILLSNKLELHLSGHYFFQSRHFSYRKNINFVFRYAHPWFEEVQFWIF